MSDLKHRCAECDCLLPRVCTSCSGGSVRELEAKLAAAEADAERYRWLRDGNDERGTPAHKIALRLYGLEWDAAIDAARGDV